MHDYPLHAVETDVLLHEGDLLVELARRPGVEILPLLKGRLAGLLNRRSPRSALPTMAWSGC